MIGDVKRSFELNFRLVWDNRSTVIGVHIVSAVTPQLLGSVVGHSKSGGTQQVLSGQATSGRPLRELSFLTAVTSLDAAVIRMYLLMSRRRTAWSGRTTCCR